MSFNSLLIHRAKIKVPSLSSSGQAFTTTASGVPCRLEPLSASRLESAAGKFPQATHRIFFKSNASISTGNRISLDIDGYAEDYEVEGVQKFYGSRFLHHQEILVKQKTK